MSFTPVIVKLHFSASVFSHMIFQKSF